MPLDVAILVATAVLAVVAVSAAVVAVRAARRISTPSGADRIASGPDRHDAPSQNSHRAPLEDAAVVASVPEPARIVEGRVVVVPTAEQVAVAALTRPSVRLATLGRGLAHALRPESRDRIVALMRREYRQRRRERLRAGRQAARAKHRAPTDPNQHWLGELPPGRGAES
ncbi:hypothetical protein ASD11_06100 [Aeromicrobium sp. Root495]|uniref:hypothetical protein n=1 Tax=Aeromicrobium sp. Root495 TaxID=1736550 RepID=UPI000701A419|nr:hypothetical protein [Aeromicrobium sp. Root495]KQY59159.1 hypothetical protein ASD11_06100 [Aeromicrobium sp. Root495]